MLGWADGFFSRQFSQFEPIKAMTRKYEKSVGMFGNFPALIHTSINNNVKNYKATLMLEHSVYRHSDFLCTKYDAVMCVKCARVSSVECGCDRRGEDGKWGYCFQILKCNSRLEKEQENGRNAECECARVTQNLFLFLVLSILRLFALISFDGK